MVDFKFTASGGYEVMVNHKHFGWISRENGFFTDPTVVKSFLEVSSDDLRKIATKVEETKHLRPRLVVS